METEICTKYRNGLSSRELATQYNCSDFKILSILRKNNEPRRTGSQVRRKYFLNENFFETINTEEKAYFLGFLYADGCVYKDKRGCKTLRLYLDAKDESILIKLNQLMTNGTKPILISRTLKGVSYNSAKLFDDLGNAGIIPNKSLVLKWPTIVPKSLMNHFVRGYFDGDGCVYSYRNYPSVSITSSKLFAEGLLNYFKKMDLRCHIYDSHKNCWYFKISAKKCVKKFHDFLYANATVWLERKRNKFIFKLS